MPSTPIIFLDIDGVLVNRKSLMDRMLYRGQKVANQDCVAALNLILDATGASIVHSSSWRFCGFDEMQLLLRYWGVRGEMIDCTPDLTRVPKKPGELYIGVPRRVEIQAWIEENGKPDRFVIIDDEPDADVDGRLVKTEF